MTMQTYEIKIKPIRWIHLNFYELWYYRELFYFFTWRDIKVKYKQTILGILWALLQPLCLMILFSVIWTKALKLYSTEIPYPIFAYSGLIFWGLFSNGVTNAGNSMITNANIIKKIFFPRIIIPVSSILAALFDFFITFLLFFIFLLYYRMDFNILSYIVYFPLSIFITSVSALGLSLMVAAANITFRDFRHIIPFLMRVLFFGSPIVIPFSAIESHKIQFILSFNPLAGAIGLARAAISGNEIPVLLVLKSLLISIILLVTGIITFKKSSIYCADLL